MNRLVEGFRLGGRYSLQSRVASGGMGDVWEAADDVLERTVAVKVMRPTTDGEPVFAERFRNEALYTANLCHPNIATVYDYGEEDSLAYLVMELVPGEPLSAIVQREGALEPARVRSIMAQSALALGAAHEAGVVHRDVKPANILVMPDGTVKLTDFGIARAVDGSGQTQTGEILGTPHYLSPEQALGEPATGSSDLYALGVVAHEMLTGRRPFEKNTPVATALSQVNDPPPPLPHHVPSELRALVEQCLAKSAAARPHSAHELGERLGLPEGELGDVDVTAADILGAAAEEETDDRPAAPPREGDPTPTPVSVAGSRRRRAQHGGPRSLHVHWAWVPASGVALALATAFAFLAAR
ncbi:serine/threonine protein kinase [Phycicoccus sp. CSK15P-2]|uniref:serine/threonine-protein kinase n=1 Tax=Phycicoccus sp. CSK15P-2 TaxID=2807627 RepID=UPI0019507CED|nr:serine/threonine-protein kinase [Phycicoccus sp. CSK15P-2]MBM6403107.1 serine/threonine protein kinase [Phycicoccus sp. CSK15P-2]